MNKVAVPLCLLLLIPGFARADTPATRPAIVTGTLAKPENTGKIAAVLGRSGVLFIRSEARWDQLQKLVPDLTPDTPLPKVDFAKTNMVLIYDTNCRDNDTLELTRPDLPNMGLPPEISKTDFIFSWDNGPEEQKEFRYAKFILTDIPAVPTVWVSVLSSPLNARPNQPKALDFDNRLGVNDGGDVVDGLQAAITTKAATIKPGDDMLIDFELHRAIMPDAHPQQFGTAPDTAVEVWDGIWSEGYRNHSFFVTTPDGKTTLLRPKEIDVWKKNAPHPVTITAKEPYHLPGENGFKSLRDLGLDTTAPGKYLITGVYEETAGMAAGQSGEVVHFWGGSIASNTITLEVEAKQ